jgi:hypothetical protein
VSGRVRVAGATVVLGKDFAAFERFESCQGQFQGQRQGSGRARDAVRRRVLRAGRDNFRDRNRDNRFPRKSMVVVYLAFSRGEVAERLKAAVC